ncbi:MAG: RNA methyltransferase [Alphaproteobacteria bacterium]|nr:RNA methyltransferase [Alphaproteobacteria bacterium]
MTNKNEQQEQQSPAIILVNPQLAENMGTTARAMLNCNLLDLRLVCPRDDWLSDKAISASSGAEIILQNAKRFETTEEAVADLNLIFASTARRRDMIKTVYTPDKAIQIVRSHIANKDRCGILFGPERTGLHNDDIAIADAVIEIPLNPVHTSLNLAQAVLLIGYEWFKSGHNEPEEQFITNGAEIASKDALLNFFNHLETELDNCGYLRLPHKRPRMVRSLRNIFERAKLTDPEVQSLHGVIKDLVTHRHRKIEENTKK